MATEEDDSERERKVYSTFIRMAFTPYRIHFRSPNYMREETLQRIDTKIVKETLRLTGIKGYIRYAIGSETLFWEEITSVLRAAITSLERRSFTHWDPSSVDYETTSSAKIAAASKGLSKDLERLNDLMAIVRNVLIAGERVQDLCAESLFNTHVYNLINCCVRVTARGYDGEQGTGDEEKWQVVVNAYKKLLITSLQFLNNLTARNEKSKLLLWMDLFDGGEPAGGNHSNEPEYLQAATAPETSYANQPIQTERSQSRSRSANKVSTLTNEKSQWKESIWKAAETAYEMGSPDDMLGFALYYEMHSDQTPDSDKPGAVPPEQYKALMGRYMSLPDEERQSWRCRWDNLRSDVTHVEAVKAVASRTLGVSVGDAKVLRLAEIEKQLHYDLRRAPGGKFSKNIGPDFTIPQLDDMKLQPELEDSYNMSCSANDAVKILENGKSDLLKRLHAYNASENPPLPKTIEEGQSPTSESEGEGVEGEDYHESTEDGRGLLTDVPLILGPSEIEILPNMIMSGLIPPAVQSYGAEQVASKDDIHTVRCHVLLAQDNGRNLLRELLIFVAAWDLREEELYFKFMVKIMEAILENGLIPYAYHAFRDYSKSRSKDIISPAQAVIMKLLTNIFRARAEAYKTATMETGVVQSPSAVEVHIVNFLFTEFRRKIVPSTCALIHFQGKIHDNSAPPEDFPLNLWDMERMYEGVYQYLEFFAVLTEEQTWKDIMAKWEVASELVTILKELEDAIPKLNPGPQLSVVSRATPDTPTAAKALPEPVKPALPVSKNTAEGSNKSGKAPIAPPSSANLITVNGNTFVDPRAAPPDPASAQGVQQQKMKEALEKMKKKKEAAEASKQAQPLPPAPVPELDTLKTPPPLPEADGQLPYSEDTQDEPSDFEWRNLKKLTVLVLSSLIWKNKTVQDQVRRFGGLEALIGCCRHDEHNPYIREHAIMCLRFAVEGNNENAAALKKLNESCSQQITFLRGGVMTLDGIEAGVAPQVPREVLDTQGYETFMDGKGQVGLRRKDAINLNKTLINAETLQQAAQQAIQTAIAGTSGLVKDAGDGKITTKMAAEKAAELMQSVLSDLPLSEALDKGTRDVILKLNKTALLATDVEAGLFSAGSSRQVPTRPKNDGSKK